MRICHSICGKCAEYSGYQLCEVGYEPPYDRPCFFLSGWKAAEGAVTQIYAWAVLHIRHAEPEIPGGSF